MKKRLTIGALMMALCIAVFGVTMRVSEVHAESHPHDAHMLTTSARPMHAGDQARADAIVAAAKKVAERYADYHKAMEDGYEIFMPNQKQSVYHFVSEKADDEATQHFDPSKPGALLYQRTGGIAPSYKLVGVMYTDGFGASMKELDDRIPLSIAQWHEHINMCVPPQMDGQWLLGDHRFGLNGSITTQSACVAVGGRFKTHLSGWMTHVYPFEKDPTKIWKSGMDSDDGMPGMKM